MLLSIQRRDQLGVKKMEKGRGLLSMLTKIRATQTLGSAICQKGNYSRGYEMYKKTINEVLSEKVRNSFKEEHLKLLQELLDSAEKTVAPKDKSWILRTGIDAVCDSCIGNVSELSASMIPSLHAEIKKKIKDATSLIDTGNQRSALDVYLNLLKKMDHNKTYKDIVSADAKSLVIKTIEFAESTDNLEEANVKVRESVDRIYDEIRLPEIYSPSAGPKTAMKSELQYQKENQLMMVDFRQKTGSLFEYNLQTVDDKVMGGISESHLESLEDKEYLRFYGTVSKFNRGGFASFRIVPTCSQSMHGMLKDIEAVYVEVMALQSTNTRFKLQLANGGHLKSFNWQSEFKVEKEGFQQINLPITSFWPTMFGHVISAPGNVDHEKVDCIGIILSHVTVDGKENSDFNEGEFDLAVRSIGVVKSKRIK